MTVEERFKEMEDYLTDQLDLANQEINELKHRVRVLEDQHEK